MNIHFWSRSLSAFCAILLMSGCANTLPKRSPPRMLMSQGDKLVVGISGFQDVNGFDYSTELQKAMDRAGVFAKILETADSADPLCDIVVRGHFAYSAVKTRTGFFYTSIYFLLIPTLSGLPTSYIDGDYLATFEVYQKGRLVKTLQYENVFREPRSWLTIYPPSSRMSSQMERVVAHLAADLRSMGL